MTLVDRHTARDARVAAFGTLALIAALSFTPTTPAHGQAPPGTAASLTGIVTEVPDGDGLRFGNLRSGKLEVRFLGAASPEDSQRETSPEGQAATAALEGLALGRLAVCHLDGSRASYGRPVGVCYVDGADLGAAQVEAGHALDCPHYSRGAYADEEARAVAEGRDLAATYERPGYCGEPTP